MEQNAYVQDGVDVDIVVDADNDDIPIAMATEVPTTEPIVVQAQQGPGLQGQATLLANSRSSRFVVQSDKTPKELSDQQVEGLRSLGYPFGIIKEINKNSQAFPLRIWVVDNSGSMNAKDGHRIVETLKSDQIRLVSCSRFAEIQETVDFHAGMAALLQAPTIFRLLNDPGRPVGPQQFSIGERGPKFIPDDLTICRNTMKKTSPSGTTPLTQHIKEIRANVIEMEEELRREGTKVAIVLATDGLPTDRLGKAKYEAKAFEDALRSLQGLPVWIIIRLCTDEDEIVDYYNSLDANLELNLEVLDDFMGEAKEIAKCNKWLNYALPLHRLREMGFTNRLFDLLDERKFSLDEVLLFLKLMFGEEKFEAVPDPQTDIEGFLNNVELIVQREQRQWNPRTRKMEPWIDMKKLKKSYARDACTIM